MTWRDISSEVLLTQMPTPAIVITTDGQVLFCNPSAADLFERPFSAVSAPLSVLDLLTQPERSRLNPLAWLKKWADTPNAPELEYVYLNCQTRSGHEKQLSVRVARIQEAKSTYFLVTMHDLSQWHERLQTERDAHRVAARLLSITADAVLIADENMHLTFANASAEIMFGYDQGQLLGTPLANLIPPQQRDKHLEHVQSFLHNKYPSRLMGSRAPVSGLTADGREIAIEASITRLNMHGKAVMAALLRERAQQREPS